MPRPASSARAKGHAILSAAGVRAWERSGKGSELHDGGGLYLRRRADGCYWALRTVNVETGGRTWAALLPGVPYPTASLEQARSEAAKARLLAASMGGQDVVRARRAAQAEARAKAEQETRERERRITVRTLFDRWAETELQPHTRADGSRTGRRDGGEYTRQQFARRVFPLIGDRPAADVTKSDLVSILDAIKAEGKLRTANVILTDLKQMFRFALVRDIVDRNPLETVTKRDAGGAEVERERVLSAEEIRQLAQQLPEILRAADEPQQPKRPTTKRKERRLHGTEARREPAVWAILATGCRVGELMAAEWRHIDLTARTWHLPDTKNGRDHTIHLSRFALAQFAALLALRPAGKDGKPVPWVFPNSDNDGPVDVKSFGKQLADRQREPSRRLKGRATRTASLALSGGRWTAHDLRRTAATLMAQLGVSGDVIDECLNHVIESRVRRTYIRDRRPQEQAQAFERLGERLAAIVAGVPHGAQIIDLEAARSAA